MSTRLDPLSFCTGKGTEQDPYRAADGTAGINTALATLTERGGRVELPCARYDLTAPIELNLSSTKLVGDVWACNYDPNGVFESKFGTKIRLNGMSFPAIRLGIDHTISGTLIDNVGVQGDIPGMDTRAYFNIETPAAGAGLCFDAVRTDQCEVDKLSFCGLGAAVVATGNAEIDACQITRCNMDGCGVGIYFSPRASYYARVRDCIIADNPYYGILVNGTGKHIHNLEITGCHFVRNGGCFTGAMPQEAAVSLLNVTNCELSRNNFDDPGTFWYYEDTATECNQRQPKKQFALALAVTGNRNRIRDNLFQNTKGDAVVIKGDHNVLMNNISDGNVIVSGRDNYICGLALRKDAKLILTAEAEGTQIFGVDPTRIVQQ